MGKEINFNPDIWSELLKLNKVNPSKITREFIKDHYGVSDRTASAYRFAIKNLKFITKDLELLKHAFSTKGKLNKLNKINKEQMKEIIELQSALDVLMELDSTPHKRYKISLPSNTAITEATAITLLSDAHVEEKIDPRVVNGINEYDVATAVARMKAYFSRLMWMIRSSRKGGFEINHLVLAILGDMITGYIHEELMENNLMSPIEATMLAQDILIDGITYLVEYGDFKTITIPMVRGNHGRTTARKRYSTGYKNSYEWLMYKHIQKWFSDHGYDNRVRFLIPESEFQTLQIYNKTWCFSHGDHFNYRGGVGGITIPFMGWMKRMLKVIPADKYAIGHWHTSINLPMGVINGSIIGYSPYAMGKALEAEAPQQCLFIQDSKRGIVRTDPILLTDWE